MPKAKFFIVPREAALRRRIPNNLPIQPTLLIGREQEVENALRILRVVSQNSETRLGKDGEPDARLLTLVGPGGVGKTRLALKVAEEVLDEAAEDTFEHGVYFVDLAPILDPELVVPAIGNVLQVQETPAVPLIATLKEHLQGKRILLVLDNFEQIMAAGAMLAELLASCPDLKILVTSRSLLRLRVEREFTVSPLTLPKPRQPLSVDKLSDYGAVELFVHRASAVEADFELTNSNAKAVVEICRRVDGLPLAIELVAAHSRLLSPQSILARLTNPLRLLAGGAQDVRRHQTMRDTIAWSYNLLSEAEQRLFRGLSVFTGGFSLRAAEGICNAGSDISIEVGHHLAIEVLEGLEALIDKSLLRRLEQREDGDRRLAMLETVREYAWEMLVANGEVEVMQQRHADYYLALTDEVGRIRPIKTQWDQLNHDRDNLRAALLWLLEQRKTSRSEDALRLIMSVITFWALISRASEIQEWLEGALAQAGPVTTSLQISALKEISLLALRQADYSRARARAEDALTAARELGDKPLIASCLNLVSGAAFGQGSYNVARSLQEEALAIYRELEDDSGIATVLINLGDGARYQGDHKGAVDFYRVSLGSFRTLGIETGVMVAAGNLGFAAYHLGNIQEARTAFMEALALAHEDRTPLGVSVVLTGLSGVSLSQVGDPRRVVSQDLWAQQAAQILGFAAGLLEQNGLLFEILEQNEFDRNVTTARERLGAEAFNAAWEEGQAMSLDQALELATRNYDEDESQAVQPRGRGRPKKRAAGGLTDRELDVAILVARGMTNPEIARQLALSARTVETHVANAMQKLGLHTRTELATWAMREGIIPEGNDQVP